MNKQDQAQEAIAFEAELSRSRAISELQSLVASAQQVLNKVENGYDPFFSLGSMATKVDATIAEWNALRKAFGYLDKP